MFWFACTNIILLVNAKICFRQFYTFIRMVPLEKVNRKSGSKYQLVKIPNIIFRIDFCFLIKQRCSAVCCNYLRTGEEAMKCSNLWSPGKRLVGFVYDRWLLNSRCFYYKQQSCVHYEDRNMDCTQAEWIPRRGVRRQHDFALTLIGLMSHSATIQPDSCIFLIYPHKIGILFLLHSSTLGCL